MIIQKMSRKETITSNHIVCLNSNLYSYLDQKDLIIYTKERVKFQQAQNGLYNSPFSFQEINGFVSVYIEGDQTENEILDYEQLIEYRKYCIQNHVSFYFGSTGTLFYKSKLYKININQQFHQAQKAHIDFSYYPVYDRLNQSKFRSSFHLKPKDKNYIQNKGMKTIEQHAHDFVVKKLKVKLIQDGKQTPTRGHPVFVAMHACGCCCRSCLRKWHKIEENHVLNENEIAYIVSILINWIEIELVKTY